MVGVALETLALPGGQAADAGGRLAYSKAAITTARGLKRAAKIARKRGGILPIKKKGDAARRPAVARPYGPHRPYVGAVALEGNAELLSAAATGWGG